MRGFISDLEFRGLRAVESSEQGRDLGSTLTYQNLLFCRVPINSILGFIIGAYKKVGFGRLW